MVILEAAAGIRKARRIPRERANAESAQTQSQNFWPKWTPVFAFVLTILSPVLVGIYNHGAKDASTDQLSADVKALGTKIDSGLASVNSRIDQVNSERQLRHDNYERDLVETRAKEAQILATTQSLSNQLDRMEDENRGASRSSR